MIQQDKKNHIDLLEQSIQRLEHHGFEEIKADLKGYESPKTFQKVGSDQTLTPDIVAMRSGKKHYFDLSVKSDNTRLLKSKWRFLQKWSDIKDHRFKIITARGHYKFTNDMLRQLNLNKKPIKLESF